LINAKGNLITAKECLRNTKEYLINAKDYFQTAREDLINAKENLRIAKEFLQPAKTKLIHHYEKTLGAVNVGGHLMIINTEAALKLIDKYFKN
jgi:hypothetical protein